MSRLCVYECNYCHITVKTDTENEPRPFEAGACLCFRRFGASEPDNHTWSFKGYEGGF